MSKSDILYFRLNIKGVAISGIWNGFQFNSRIITTLYKYYGTIVFLTFVTFNMSQFIEMFSVITNLPMLMQNAGVTLFYVVVSLKLCTIRFRTKRVEQLFDRMRNEEKRAYTRNAEEVKIYNETVEQNLFMTKLLWILFFLTWAGFYISKPAEYWMHGPQEIYHYKVPFLYSSWFPFDRYAHGYYMLAYSFQMLSGTIGTIYVAVTDTLYVGFIIFGIGQYRIIQCAIRNLHISNKYCTTNKQDLSLIDVYEEVTDIIKHHCRIIEYYEDLEELITPIIFLQFLLTSLMICAVGMEGIMSGLSVRFALSLEYVSVLLVQLFNYYWHANEVTVQSGNVGKAVAESKWYKFSPRVKQALMMVMIRSEKPSTLSVGGFYVMSLNTFLMIIRTTYSFLALFRTIYARDDA